MKDPSNDKCLRIVTEILHLLKSTNQYEEAFHLLVDRIVRIYNCQSCAIVTIDPKSEYLKIENSRGISLTFCKTFRRQFSTGAIGNLLWTGRPILIGDSSAQPRIAEELQLEHPFASCACVQIGVNQLTLGYLYADSLAKHAFKEEDLPILQAFADFAALAYYKSRLAEENMRLDRIDHETGLQKYTPFLEEAATHLVRAQSFSEPLSIVICDIDNFKLIAHTYGYDTSRALRREIGEHIKNSLRPIDIAARYGYDEFIILRTRSACEDSLTYANGLCTSISAMTFTPQGIRTTISAGLAVFPQNGRTIDDLVLSAKKALFEAQRTGRNKVFHFPAVWYARRTHGREEEFTE
jgi:diguanylate cyclase (GGDEF)-like protein